MRTAAHHLLSALTSTLMLRTTGWRGVGCWGLLGTLVSLVCELESTTIGSMCVFEVTQWRKQIKDQTSAGDLFLIQPTHIWWSLYLWGHSSLPCCGISFCVFEFMSAWRKTPQQLCRVIVTAGKTPTTKVEHRCIISIEIEGRMVSFQNCSVKPEQTSALQL